MAATDVAMANQALSLVGEQLVVNSINENDRLKTNYAAERDSVLALHPWNWALKRDRVKAAGLLDCSSKVITFVVNSGADTITDDTSSFVSNGFEDGDIANITGSGANEATYNIADVAAGTLTCETSEVVVAEVATNSETLKLYALAANGQYKFKIPDDCLRVTRVAEWTRYNQPYTWAREGKFIVTKSIDSNDELPMQYIRRITDPTIFDKLFEELFKYKLCAMLSMGDKENMDQAKYWNKHFDYKFKQISQRNAFEGNHDETQEDTDWMRAGRRGVRTDSWFGRSY